MESTSHIFTLEIAHESPKIAASKSTGFPFVLTTELGANFQLICSLIDQLLEWSAKKPREKIVYTLVLALIIELYCFRNPIELRTPTYGFYENMKKNQKHCADVAQCHKKVPSAMMTRVARVLPD